MKKLSVTTARPCQSRSFVIRKTLPDDSVFSCLLVMTRDRHALKLMINHGESIRMVSFTDQRALVDAQGFLAIQDPAKVAGKVVSSLPTQEIDDELFFDKVIQNLFLLKLAGVLDPENFAYHAKMVEHFREMLDSELLIAHLNENNLADVATDSLVYRTSLEEIIFWKTIWRTVVSKAATLDKTP